MLNDTIKKARMYSCLTQAEMAKLMAISKSKYQRKESGASKIERNELAKFAKVLGLDESQLLTYWMADNIYDILKKEQKLKRTVLDLIEEHLDDYETCMITLEKSDSYSTDNERFIHKIYK